MIVQIPFIPPEVWRLIMAALHSTADLHALISASPDCLATFTQLSPREANQQVLGPILLRSWSRQTMATAQALAWFDGSAASRARLVASMRSKFDVDQWTREAPRRKGLELFCEHARDMAKLHRVVRLFVRSYAREATRLMADPDAMGYSKMPGLAPYASEFDNNFTPAPLSETEEARLERAFYRFHIYCVAYHPLPFPVPEFRGNDDVMKVTQIQREQSNDFFLKLDAFATEEMHCVYLYFLERLGEIALAVQRDIAREAERFDATGEMERTIREDPKKGFTYMSTYRAQKLYWFSSPDRLETFWDALGDTASLGLPFLHDLLLRENTTLSEQWDTIRRKTIPRQEFYADAVQRACQGNLVMLQPLDEYHQALAKQDPTAFVESTSLPSFGYGRFTRFDEFDTRQNKILPVQVNTTMTAAWYGPLRRMGYVFWDVARLARLEGTLSLRLATERVSGRERDQFWWDWCVERYDEGQNVLRGMKMSKVFIDGLVEKYGLVRG